jgi:hypothetical protein
MSKVPKKFLLAFNLAATDEFRPLRVLIGSLSEIALRARLRLARSRTRYKWHENGHAQRPLILRLESNKCLNDLSSLPQCLTRGRSGNLYLLSVGVTEPPAAYTSPPRIPPTHFPTRATGRAS